MATLKALQSFHAPGRFVASGDELDARDAVVAGREHLFEQVEADPPKPRKAVASKKAAPKAED